MKKIIIVLMMLLIIPLVASEVMYDNPRLPKARPPTTEGNSTFNESYTDTLYLFLDGSNANQNIDIGNYNFTTEGVGTFGNSGTQFYTRLAGYVLGQYYGIYSEANGGVAGYFTDSTGQHIVRLADGTQAGYFEYQSTGDILKIGTWNKIINATGDSVFYGDLNIDGDLSLEPTTSTINFGDGGTTDVLYLKGSATIINGLFLTSSAFANQLAMSVGSGATAIQSTEDLLISASSGFLQLASASNYNMNLVVSGTGYIKLGGATYYTRINPDGTLRSPSLNTTSDLIIFGESNTNMNTSQIDGDGYFEFYGNNSYIWTAENDFLDSKSTGSFSAWVQLKNMSKYAIVGIYITDSISTSSMMFRVNTNGNLSKVWNPDGGNGWASLDSTCQISDNTTFHHVAFTTKEIWLDGVNCSWAYTSYSGSAIDDWFDDIYQVGSHTHHFGAGWLKRSTPAIPTDALVDEIMLFDDVLNTTEIDYLNDTGRNAGGYSGTGDLIHHWRAYNDNYNDNIGGEHMSPLNGASVEVEINDTILLYEKSIQAGENFFSSDGSAGFTGKCPTGTTPDFKDGLAVGCS